jgi:hypothetical protein
VRSKNTPGPPGKEHQHQKTTELPPRCHHAAFLGCFEAIRLIFFRWICELLVSIGKRRSFQVLLCVYRLSAILRRRAQRWNKKTVVFPRQLGLFEVMRLQ